MVRFVFILFQVRQDSNCVAAGLVMDFSATMENDEKTCVRSVQDAKGLGFAPDQRGSGA